MYVDPDPECDEEGWGEARSAAAAITLVVAFLGSYVAVHGFEQFFSYVDWLGPYGAVVQFGLIGLVLVLHEAVHALGYVTIGGLSRDDIAVEFGLDADSLTDPLHHSVHPTRPLQRWRYMAGVAAPGVVLGVVPAALALATGNSLAAFVAVAGLLLVATDVHAIVDCWRSPEGVAASEPTI